MLLLSGALHALPSKVLHNYKTSYFDHHLLICGCKLSHGDTRRMKWLSGTGYVAKCSITVCRMVTLHDRLHLLCWQQWRPIMMFPSSPAMSSFSGHGGRIRHAKIYRVDGTVHADVIVLDASTSHTCVDGTLCT